MIFLFQLEELMGLGVLSANKAGMDSRWLYLTNGFIHNSILLNSRETGSFPIPDKVCPSFPWV